MKLHLARRTGRNAFTGYGPGYVAVNGVQYDRSLIVLPQEIITDWHATTFATLEAGHFARLAALPAEIVLLGTGVSLQFPSSELIRPLVEAKIGLEVMDVQAACRTFNILVDEERKVAAALLLA